MFFFFFSGAQHTHPAFVGLRTPPTAEVQGYSVLVFPLLGPEPQNVFCVIRSRRSYGKLLVGATGRRIQTSGEGSCPGRAGNFYHRSQPTVTRRVPPTASAHSTRRLRALSTRTDPNDTPCMHIPQRFSCNW